MAECYYNERTRGAFGTRATEKAVDLPGNEYVVPTHKLCVTRLELVCRLLTVATCPSWFVRFTG